MLTSTKVRIFIFEFIQLMIYLLPSYYEFKNENNITNNTK